MNDTIFALATPPGRGAVAIVRVSGLSAARVLVELSGRALPAARRASLRRLHGAGGGPIDEAVVIWWPGPRSYTGEDCLELHLHGGSAVSAAVVERLSELGLRLAEPGEFTRRAFERGRLDLTQAEAVADLVEAETSAQRRQALAQLGGALSERYESWRDRLLDALALLEAAVDFPDEDLPPEIGDHAIATLDDVAREIGAAIADVRGERVRDGMGVVLIGAPNAGKSSLMNALLGRDAVIVTAIPGTTRDVVEGALVLAGQLVRLSDTAGLRDTDDVVETEGVRRAYVAAAAADLRIGVIDRARTTLDDALLSMLRPGDILAMNKSDLGTRAFEPPSGVQAIATVATTGGVTALREALSSRMATLTSAEDAPVVTRARHRTLLQEASSHLGRAQADLKKGAELAAENVRLAIRSVERVTGRTNPEAVLDRVFASFCIGK